MTPIFITSICVIPLEVTNIFPVVIHPLQNQQGKNRKKYSSQQKEHKVSQKVSTYMVGSFFGCLFFAGLGPQKTSTPLIVSEEIPANGAAHRRLLKLKGLPRQNAPLEVELPEAVDEVAEGPEDSTTGGRATTSNPVDCPEKVTLVCLQLKGSSPKV